MSRSWATSSRPWTCFLVLGGIACAGDAGSSQTRVAGEGGLATSRRLEVDSAALARVHERAAELERLRSLLIAHRGQLVAEWYFHGASADEAANVKSVSKSVMSALVGIAISEGLLEGVDQKIAPLFQARLPDDVDPRMDRVTIGHLLTMRSGLQSTSFGNYGRWVTSRDWVGHVLTRPFASEPGGRMIYSTGNTHLLSAIITEVADTSTWAYAWSRLAEPLGISLPRWQRDPQGIYFGGNNMQMTPRGMLRFGELYRNAGRFEGRQIVPEEWVRASWTPQTRSPWNGYRHGYGWWSRELRGQRVNFAWGYGGQFIFVVPDLELTVVMTSDPSRAARGYRSGLFSLLSDQIMATLKPASAAAAGSSGAEG